jgi:tetratricopeptide (TPR) repeat protein
MHSSGHQLPDGSQAVEGEARCAGIDSVRSRACLLEESKNYEAAAQVWLDFIQQHPEDAEAINELGIALSCAGRFEEGLTCFRQALKIRPDLISAKTNAGVALRRTDKIQEAISQFQEVAEATPDDMIACFNLGTTLHLAEQYDQALVWLQKAVDLSPSHAGSAQELAKVLLKLKRNEEAIRAYRHAISLSPNCVESLLSLGALLQEEKQFDEAVPVLNKVVQLDPNQFDGWLRLGCVLLHAGREAESIGAFRRALAIQPGSVVGYCNMALALSNLGRVEEAIEVSRKAICIEPGAPVATFNMGTMLLSLGNFREGWQAYSYRYAMQGEKWLEDEAHAAPWTGESLAGKSILILGEQGNGDHLQFVRYLPALSDLGARVSYLAPERLHRLLGTLGGSLTLLSEIPQNSRFDFQCPLMHLPGIFDTLEMPVPNKVPYLAAEPERVDHWRRRIGDQGFRVGIVWQGNQYDGNTVRSFPLAALRPLAEIRGVRLISLQINDGVEQLSTLHPGMQVEQLGSDFDSGDHGFIDAAAVIEVVDLIVSCDTSLVHLAGALGRPVWIALNEPPEWRWQRERNDSIWYPTATLFRQDARGDWDGVFLRIAESLKELTERRSIAAADEIADPPRAAPHVKVSWGEFLDKISILEIKAQRITSPAAVANVRLELEHLSKVLSDLAPLPTGVEEKRASLRATNEKLWDLEDAVRACESNQKFDARFVELARQIYAGNDERAKIKQEINTLMKSAFVEEKEHAARSL